ncbi:unnamed protein product [Rotaria sordida]|uniref:Uncharacterized protein n=1 Tax=Rotaria sordida TaxID=392033 RepID=A0A819ZP44_9BILA|nr:unnamed protein product [Rotaria sordida]
MIEETMPDYDISSHFIYSIAKFLVMLSHDTLHSKQDQSLLNIYSTQLTLFDVVSSFELRPIDPFVVAFRASTIRNLNNFEKILNDFRQSLVHDETVYCLDIFSYLTSLNEYFKLLL